MFNITTQVFYIFCLSYNSRNYDKWSLYSWYIGVRHLDMVTLLTWWLYRVNLSWCRIPSIISGTKLNEIIQVPFIFTQLFIAFADSQAYYFISKPGEIFRSYEIVFRINLHQWKISQCLNTWHFLQAGTRNKIILEMAFTGNETVNDYKNWNGTNLNFMPIFDITTEIESTKR